MSTRCRSTDTGWPVIDESAPIAADEWLIRLVFWDCFIRPRAFQPRDGRNPDTDGLSLFREACLPTPEAALAAVAEDKRDYYGIVAIPVACLAACPFPLSVIPAPNPDVRGHAIIPELNIAAFKRDKASLARAMTFLAEIAERTIRRAPIQNGPP